MRLQRSDLPHWLSTRLRMMHTRTKGVRRRTIAAAALAGLVTIMLLVVLARIDGGPAPAELVASSGGGGGDTSTGTSNGTSSGVTVDEPPPPPLLRRIQTRTRTAPAVAETATQVTVHYCLIHARDLATPHARCFNASTDGASTAVAASIKSRLRRNGTAPSRRPRRSLLQTDESDAEDDTVYEEVEADDAAPGPDQELVDDDAAAAPPKPAEAPAPNLARYPCLPVNMRFDSEADMLAELGVVDEAERSSTLLVMRGDENESDDATGDGHGDGAGAAPPRPGDAELVRSFLRQYERLTAPRPIWPPGQDPGSGYTRAFDARRPAPGSDGAPPFATSPPRIAGQDLLLFHDRLSWTLFAQEAAACPFDTTPYGGDYTGGRSRPEAFDDTRPSKDQMCLPHHELLFGPMGTTMRRRDEALRPASGNAEQEGALPIPQPQPRRQPRQTHSCRPCDGHASARHLLVPRGLFRTTLSELACRPGVHSLLDALLELQDHNERWHMQRHLARREAAAAAAADAPPPAPAPAVGDAVGAAGGSSAPPTTADSPFAVPDATAAGASSPGSDSAGSGSGSASGSWWQVWNPLGPDGLTRYWNSDSSFWIIDSAQRFVEPTAYASQERIDSGDVHRDYPPLHEAGVAAGAGDEVGGADQTEQRGRERQRKRERGRTPPAPVRVMCCSRGSELSLPSRPPPLHPRSPAFHHLHDSFPPPEGFDTSPAAPRPVPVPGSLATFLQPLKGRTLHGWTARKFGAWVDVQGQGRHICQGCVLRWDYCRYVAGKLPTGANATSAARTHAHWENFDYFSCALAGQKDAWAFTERGRYLEEKGYIARVDRTPYTSLESRPALDRRGIRRVVYSDGHVSWHGCSTSTPLCCTVRSNNPPYPLGCRQPRKDGLWVQTAPCCIKHYVALYHYLVTLFEQHHVEWSLGFGSLLTALRSDGASNPYDYDADIIVYYKGYTQIKALIPVIESAGYVVIPNWSSSCTRDCELYRVLHQSPDHLHQSTVDIFLQHRDDQRIHPFNATATFLHRAARVPHGAAAYLDRRYPGWRGTQLLTVENWAVDPATGAKPPWLMSSLRKVRRPFNRSMETVTLPPWARPLHAYAEWDLEHAGIDRRDERTPNIEIVWRPEQMDLK